MSPFDTSARRPLRRILSLLLAVPVPGLAVAEQAAPPARDECVVATLRSGEEAPAQRLRSLAGVDYWVEADLDLLLCSSGGALSADALAAAARGAGALSVVALPGVERARLAFLKVTPGFDVVEIGRPLARGGRWVVLELSSDAPAARLEELRRGAEAGRGPGPDRLGPALYPFEANRVLARRWSRDLHGSGDALTDPQIASMLDEIDRDRWFADVVTLADWDRWTRGADIPSARDWLVAQFGPLHGFSVTTSEFWVPPSGSYPGVWAQNVIATIPGTHRPDEWYVVGGHYDSTSDQLPISPGADDNASGCAGTLELARLFANHPPEATVVFVCFSGEEQGLYGSYAYVDELIAAGTFGRVQGAYIVDMIAFTSGITLNTILETLSFAQAWMDQFADAAADFTTLDITFSYDVCCSDHAPFLSEGRPAVLAIEADYWANPNYHHVTDLPGYLNPVLAEQILRMGGGALLRAAGSTTILVDGFETGATLRWSATVP
jgi:hypothetical protein